MITKQDRRMGWPPWHPAVHDVKIEFRKMDFEGVDPHRPLGLTAARAPAPLPEEAHGLLHALFRKRLLFRKRRPYCTV